MAKCKCKYYRFNKAGQLVCSVCGKLADGTRPEIEDKQDNNHETKAPLYVSDKKKKQRIMPKASVK